VWVSECLAVQTFCVSWQDIFKVSCQDTLSTASPKTRTHKHTHLSARAHIHTHTRMLSPTYPGTPARIGTCVHRHWHEVLTCTHMHMRAHTYIHLHPCENANRHKRSRPRNCSANNFVLLVLRRKKRSSVGRRLSFCHTIHDICAAMYHKSTQTYHKVGTELRTIQKRVFCVYGARYVNL